MADNIYIEDLILKFLKKEISADEQSELDQWIGASEKNKVLFEDLTDQKVLEEKLIVFHEIKLTKEDARKKLLPFKVHRIFPFRRVAAAAVILLLISVGGYFYFNQGTLRQAQRDIVVKEIEAPKLTKATITLANGQQISLDSIANGTLATQGDVNVFKNKDGEIVYSGNATEIAYNTLHNPRGSMVVTLTLNDGTKVWLNAESSLRYPTAFVGSERKVEITGEAYFEVAKNENMPFIVSKNDVSVKVLGTHFNVNSYENEGDIKITLLEGSVQVTNQQASMLIKPGQQAQVTNLIKIIKVDTDDVMAWKNGYFQFNGMNIQGVMRQLERWYDINVRYEGKIKERAFAGQIDRNANLSEVLKILKESNVQFEVRGNEIIVKQ